MDIEERVATLEADSRNRVLECQRCENRLTVLEGAFAQLRTDVRVLETRVAMYAAGGALAGGILVSVARDLISKYLGG